MNWRSFQELFSAGTMKLALLGINSLAFLLVLVLAVKAWPIIVAKPLLHLLSTAWHPLQGRFGLGAFIVGTVEVTGIAVLLAVPVCILSAIYLTEYAHRYVRDMARLFFDTMAGIPSVLYGLCGVLVVVPAVKALGEALGTPTSGYSLLAGGVILALMVCPIIISVAVDVLQSIPAEAREAALALGATRWETVSRVLLRHGRRGIISAVIFGVARAMGETMAVLMVVGNVARVPGSVFDPAYPIPALIANNYGEMMSVPLYDSALMLAAFALVLVSGVLMLAAHFTLLQLQRR